MYHVLQTCDHVTLMRALQRGNSASLILHTHTALSNNASFTSVSDRFLEFTLQLLIVLTHYRT